ncbi:hypothetical protein ACFVR1_04405 [Psychrobacillus sp. NPDC058041]|uniref:hypothetical protein n=1 Tax=Psychrobacillus sp. NPDC058041 TaxID=3346310 RepID=UPI0036DE414E
MKKTFRKKLKAFIPYFFVIIAFCCLSYLLVYQASFLPNGYEIMSGQKNELTITSFSLIGKEKTIQTIEFSKQDEWKLEEIEGAVKRQKDALLLLYTALGVSFTLIIMRVRTGMHVRKAISQSNLIFAILIPLVPLVSAWHRIQSLIV